MSHNLHRAHFVLLNFVDRASVASEQQVSRLTGLNMNLASVLRQFPTSEQLRAHAKHLKQESLHAWLHERHLNQVDPDRRHRSDYMRGDILNIAADLREHSNVIAHLCKTDNAPLRKALRQVAKTCKQHMDTELAGLQAILDLLVAANQLEVHDGVTRATANSWMAIAEKLVSESRKTFNLERRLTIVHQLIDKCVQP